MKDSDGNILTDENKILSRWREYFEDFLNPVKASTRDTHEVTHLGEDEVFTAAEVATAINTRNPEISPCLEGRYRSFLTGCQ